MSGLAGLIARAGFAPGTPVGLARVGQSGLVEEAIAGNWPDGRPVGTQDHFYVGSLAKEVTGVAAALLVRDGQLDADAPVSRYLPALPSWADRITPRQLAHHTAGLPAAGEMERALGSSDWTMARMLAALSELREPHDEPGRAHVYSNVGYILLAQIVAEVASMSFEHFAQTRLFAPLGLDDMVFAGLQIDNFPQAPLLGPSRPLTVGDGGLWSSAGAFARWLDAQNHDALGVAAIVEAPARLGDGQNGDYGWGIGVRSWRGVRSFIHAGQWQGAVARSVRCPDLGLSVVAMASGPSVDALGALIDAALVN
jgi:CubicO group peptidase (beta-lactamase class C family)